jgi:hypothetical protein
MVRLNESKPEALGELQNEGARGSFCGGSTLHTLTRPLRSRQVMHTLVVEALLILSIIYGRKGHLYTPGAGPAFLETPC